MREDYMRRREFITLLGGATTCAVSARAQQPSKLLTIGFLGAIGAEAGSLWVAAMQRDGRYRWNTGRSADAADTVAPDPKRRFASVKVPRCNLRLGEGTLSLVC